MKVKSLLYVSTMSVLGALFLRCAKGNPLREWITDLIGYDWRACLEHMLTGIGVPLFIPVAIVLSAYHGDRLLNSWTRGRLPCASGTAEEYTAGKLLLVCVASIAIVFLIVEHSFELKQAYVSVYGKAPRGYFQYDQYVADVLGVIISVRLAIHYWWRRPRWTEAPVSTH